MIAASTMNNNMSNSNYYGGSLNKTIRRARLEMDRRCQVMSVMLLVAVCIMSISTSMSMNFGNVFHNKAMGSTTSSFMSDAEIRNDLLALSQTLKQSRARSTGKSSRRTTSHRANNDADGYTETRGNAEKTDYDDDSIGNFNDHEDGYMDIKPTTVSNSKYPSSHDLALMGKYGVSSEERERCIAELNNNLMQSPNRKVASIHDRLQYEIEQLAIASMCSTSRKFVISPLPHFGGGRKQFVAYMQKRGWHMDGWNSTRSHKSPPVAAISSCIYNLAFKDLATKVALISATPNERGNLLKIPFYSAVRELFDSRGCDYRIFHPESFLVETTEQCHELMFVIQQALSKETSSSQQQTLWFFKDK